MKNKSEFSRKKIEILKTAQRIFARYGYQKTTMEDISNELGLTKSSLYYYYKNKESIFKDVILFESNLYLERLSRELSSVSDPEEKMIIFCRQKIDHFQYMVNLHRLSLDVIHEIRPIVQDLYKDFLNNEKRILSDHLRPLMSVPENLELIVDGLLWLLESYKIQFFHLQHHEINLNDKDMQLSRERLIKIVHIFYRGIHSFF